MSNFWVVENPGGGWNVKEESIEDPVSHHDTQAAAIRAAHPLLIDTGGGELIVQDRHGRIRQKDTIGRHDPYPPKG
jgi:hypothetical protein